MKINKITDKALLESVKKQLNEGTGNFYFENVCLLVTDDDYETGNYPEFENRPINYNRNYPQYPLKDWNDGLNCWNIVYTPGYYEHACIDFVEIDTDVWDVVGGYSLESSISRYQYDKELDKWFFVDYTKEEKEISEQEVIDGVIACFDLEHQSLLSVDKIKEAIEDCKDDGYYGLSAFVLSDVVLEDIIDHMVEAEKKIVEDRIQQIKQQYGYKSLGVTARFSNGETWYGEVDEAKEEEITILVDVISDDDTELTKENFDAQYGKHGVKCVKIENDEAYVKGTHAALTSFLGEFAMMDKKEAKQYIKDYKESANDLTEDTDSDEQIWPKTTYDGNRYKEDNLSGLPETVVIKYPAFEVEYFVRPGKQYRDHKTIFDQDSLAVLSIKQGEADAVEHIFKKAVKDSLKAYGQENLYFGASALVSLPSGITVHDNADLNEALYGGNQTMQFFQLCKEVGIETMGELEDFLKYEKEEGESELDALIRYRDELGTDFKIKA